MEVINVILTRNCKKKYNSVYTPNKEANVYTTEKESMLLY